MKTETLATAIIISSIALTGFQVVYTQVLDRDVVYGTISIADTANPEP